MEIFVIIWFFLLGNAVDDVYGPGVVGPIECVGVACDADHGNRPAMERATKERATNDAPDAPDTPDVPDDEPDDEPDDDGKPGHGHGDKNHDHRGPPGQNKK